MCPGRQAVAGSARTRGWPPARAASSAARIAAATAAGSALICFGVKCSTRMPCAVSRA